MVQTTEARISAVQRVALVTAVFVLGLFADAASAQSPNDIVEEAVALLAERIEGRKEEFAQDKQALYALINEMLGELKTSHLALLDYTVWQRELAMEFRNRPTVRAGLGLVKLDGGYFASGIAEAGPAEKEAKSRSLKRTCSPTSSSTWVEVGWSPSFAEATVTSRLFNDSWSVSGSWKV